MSSADIKKNFINYLSMTIVVSYLIIITVSKAVDNIGIVSFIGFCVLLVVIGILSPVNHFMKLGVLSTTRAIAMISICAVLVIVFIISGSEIIFSKNYNLRYTYWIAAASLNIVMAVYLLRPLVEEYKKRKAENRKFIKLYILGTAVVILLFQVFQGYVAVQSFFHPKRQIVLDDLIVPKRIVIYRCGYDEEGKKPLRITPINEISSNEDIKKITKELSSLKVENISSIDLINYNRMKDNNYPYFMLRFEYADTNGLFTKLEDGCIEDMVITANRNIVIEEPNEKKGFALYGKYYFEIFPVKLSEETVNMIFSYLKV